jgi:PAS domain S-box-containing protein
MSEPFVFLSGKFERGVTSGAGGVEMITADNALPGPQAAGEQAYHFHRLLDALPAAVYTTDAEGNITYYNDAAADLWGHRPTPGSRKWNGSLRLFRPDGTVLAHSECPMAVALKEERQLHGVEAAAERPDGTRVPFHAYPTPLYDDTGRLTGGINMMVDITERKYAEERQLLLIRELHHRVKNTLASVQAIMGATARSTDNIEDFKTALIGRIGSLANTHLLLAEETRTVSFADILGKELGAFDDGHAGRIVATGPPVALSTRLAVSLGMALHELVTNAARFGALSAAGGKVTATWRVTIEAERRTLDFDWVESGGPPVDQPARKGFGTRLLETVLPGQIQASTKIDYAPDGVRVHYAVPLPAGD